MHDNRERHQHIPPADPPLKKDGRLFKPVHVIIGAVILVAILIVYIVQIARAGY
jgi:hypothetical protein